MLHDPENFIAPLPGRLVFIIAWKSVILGVGWVFYCSGHEGFLPRRSQRRRRGSQRRSCLFFTTEDTEEFHREHGGFCQAFRRRPQRFDLAVSNRSLACRSVAYRLSLRRLSHLSSLINHRGSTLRSQVACRSVAYRLSPIAYRFVAHLISHLSFLISHFSPCKASPSTPSAAS